MLHAGKQVPVARGEGRPSAESAVDVEPEVFVAAEIGQSLEIVYGAGVGGAGRPHNAEGYEPAARSCATAALSAARSIW